jgi:uncharacterized membrane protein
MKILKWILCILTLLATVLMLFILPDTVPMHFGINGEPDSPPRSKFELLILPVILIACAFVLDPLKKSYCKRAEETEDEKERAEHLSNAKVLNITGIITMFLFFAINLVALYNTYIYSFPDKGLPKFDIISAVGVIMGVTLAVIANFMPKTRRNSNIGFRLPWTLYNDVTWRKSNLFASYILMISGVFMAIVSFLPEIGAIIGSISFLIALTIIMVYAYMIYTQERKKDNERNNKK